MRLLKGKEAMHLCGIARTTQWRQIQDGLHPPPVRAGSRAVRFIESEIQALIEARARGVTDDELRRIVADMVQNRVKAHVPQAVRESEKTREAARC